MANKGTIKTGFERSSTGYMLGVTYTEGSKYICSTILDWEIKSQDVVNGSSLIAWKLSVDCSTLNKADSDAAYITVKGSAGVQSNKYYEGSSDYDRHQTVTVSQTRINNGETVEIATGEFTVTHTSKGTKTLYTLNAILSDIVGIYDEDGTSIAYLSTGGKTLVGTGVTVVLDTIAKQGLIKTAPNFNDEESPTITYAIPKESTAAWVGIAIGGSTVNIPYRAVAVSSSSYPFKFTQAEKETMWAILARGVHTTEARFYIKTTCNGNTLESYEARTLEIINFMPTFDTDVWDSNTDVVSRLTGNNRVLVRYATNASYTTGGEAKKGAEIDVQSVKNGDLTKYGPSGTFEKVTDNQFHFAIVDTFGRSHTETMEFSRANAKFIDYVKLTCSIETTEMTADGDVQVIIKGKCFTGDFGIKTNRLRVNYDIVKNNEDDFTHVDLGYADLASRYGNSFTVNGNDYTYVLNITGLEYLSVYDFTVRVSDEVAVEGNEAFTVLAAVPMFDWGREDFNFNVDVEMQGNLEVAGTLKVGGVTQPTIVAQSMSDSGWSYRKWSDGWAECWRNLSVTSAVSTGTNASWYSSGELSTTNLSYPFTFAARPTLTVQTMPTGTSYCIVFPSNTAGTTAKTGSFQLMSMTSLTSRAHLLTYIVKGRWK